MKNMIFYKITSLLTYSASTIISIFFNKLILSKHHFSMHFFLILVHSTTIVLILTIYFIYIRKMPFKRFWKLFIPSIFLCMMLFSNIKTTFYFPITLFTLYKNISIILIAILEHKIFNKKITINASLSFILIILTSYTANISDHVSIYGYIWMILNVLSTAIYMVLLKYILNDTSCSKMEVVFLTNAFSIPVIGSFSYFYDSIDFKFDNRILWFYIFISSVGTFFVSITTSWALQAVSSTAVCMVGASSKLLLSMLGFIFLKEIYTLLKLVSITVGILASFIYSYDSIKHTEIR